MLMGMEQDVKIRNFFTRRKRPNAVYRGRHYFIEMRKFTAFAERIFGDIVQNPIWTTDQKWLLNAR